MNLKSGLVRQVAVSLLALLTAGRLAPAAAAELPSEKDSWIRLETANFTVFSNAGEKKTKRIALGVETLRAALGAVFESRQLQTPLATRIYVFRDEESFRPYSRWAGRPLTKVAGFFFAA